jgi:hypothetical protein
MIHLGSLADLRSAPLVLFSFQAACFISLRAARPKTPDGACATLLPLSVEFVNSCLQPLCHRSVHSPRVDEARRSTADIERLSRLQP